MCEKAEVRQEADEENNVKNYERVDLSQSADCCWSSWNVCLHKNHLYEKVPDTVLVIAVIYEH